MKLVAKAVTTRNPILSARSEVRTTRYIPKEQLLLRYQTPFAPELEGMEPPEKFNMLKSYT